MKTLKLFYENPEFKDSKIAIENWYKEVIKADWKSPSDIKNMFGNASFIGNNRVVFNIHGNKYRLVTKIQYNLQVIFIRFIGTHEKYDKIDAKEI